MKRGWIIFWTMIGLLAGMLMGAVPVFRQIRQKETERVYLKELKDQMESVSARTYDRQLGLAKWYNWNLTADVPDTGFELAYDQILSFQDGAMALLILPGTEMPVYHQGVYGLVPGAEHRADSALPIGGRGNHCELLLPEGVDLPELREDAAVAVCCMGRTVFYRSTAGNVEAGENQDLLTLVSADGSEQCLLHRSSAILIAEEKGTIPAGWINSALTAAILLTLLPILTGICCKGLGKLRRWNRNYWNIRGKRIKSGKNPEKRWL